MDYQILGLAFFTALLLSLFAVPFTVPIARKLGAVDVPKERSSHTWPTTRLGGLGMAASLLVACLMFLPLDTFSIAFLAGLLFILITGLLDDILDIGPRWKFLGQIGAAAVFVLLGGGSLEHLGAFLGLGQMQLGQGTALLFTIFCLVGGMNAFNLSDGLDGLAAGFAAIAAMFFTYFCWKAGAHDLLLVCVALMGAVLGFLRYNSHPARLFMGDTGSLLLGYVLGAVLVSGSQRAGAEVPPAAWVAVAALPLFDTLLVMTRRMCKGCSPFQPDRTHLHHRLLQLGLPHSSVVAVMYGLMAMFGLAAVLLHKQPDWVVFAVLMLMGAGVFAVIELLERSGAAVIRQMRRHSRFRIARQPWMRSVLHGLGASVPWVGVLLLAGLSLPVLFLPALHLSRNELLSLLLLAGIIVFYGVQRNQASRGILHGATYAAIFVLLFVYNLTEYGSGVQRYLLGLSAAAAIWVGLKLLLRRRAAVLRPSSFELLLLLFSWFLPFVLFEELRLPASVVEAGRTACLQALPLMLATKLYFNARPQGSMTVIVLLSATISLIALRGL